MSRYGKQYWSNILGEKWTLILKDLLRSEYSEKLIQFLEVQYSMTKVNPPKLDQVFLPFKTCNWDDIKIVIVTAEPHSFVRSSGYGYGEPYTTGFHSNKITKIYDAIQRAYYTPYDTFYFDFDFSLENWAKQGILLLNLSLTVEQNNPGSHQKPWNKFTSEVLNRINEEKTGIIFLLLGERPMKLKQFINRNHYVIEEECPKDYSLNNKEFPESCFLEIDSIIKKLYNEKINW
jgi:uracil-DNA glycosylase